MSSDPYTVRLAIGNQKETPLKLWIEPWVEEFELPPGTEVEVRLSGNAESRVEVEYHQDAILVFGFYGSFASVFRDGKLIWECHARLASPP